MGLDENLRNARLALDHVRRIGMKTNSRLEDMRSMSDKEWADTAACLIQDNGSGGDKSVRAQIQNFCQDQSQGQSDPQNWMDTCLQQKPAAIDKLAELAAGKKCGNCTEQDAEAIQYLRDTLKVRPLDLMNLKPYSGVDHTFVVIGRRRPQYTVHDPDWFPQPQCHLLGSLDKDPSTWGPEAVVCDPWHDGGKAYPATEIHAKMFRGYTGAGSATRAVTPSGVVQPFSIMRIE
jgi:hypothetical protein